MHWLVYPFLAFIGILATNEILYLAVAIILSIIIIMVLHVILYNLFMLLIGHKIDNDYFEYNIRREYSKSIIYLLLAFIMGIYILLCWQLGWVNGWFYYIPFWAAFLFCIILAIVKARPVNKRQKWAKELLEFN